MVYEMESFLESCVEQYLELSGRERSSLRTVATPYISDDGGSSGPARVPMSTGPHIRCECCGHTFPESVPRVTPEGSDPSPV